jgi:integrase
MRIPKYRRHSSGIGFVCWKKVRHYFSGKFNSPESVQAYKNFISEIVKPPGPPLLPPRHAEAPTIAEILGLYLTSMHRELCANGKTDSAWYHIKRMASFVMKSHAMLPINDFGPLALRRVRDEMVAAKKVRWFKKNPDCPRQNVLAEKDGHELVEIDQTLSRRYINEQVSKVRRFFSWAVAEEYARESTAAALRHLPPLRRVKRKRGEMRTESENGAVVREGRKVRPADDEAVRKVVAVVSPTIAAMIQLAELTGMRPTEICIMRPCDVDRSKEVWEYKPTEYKTDEIDAADGVEQPVCIGPLAQEVLLPFLDRDPEAFVFDPRESIAWANKQRWEKSKAARRTSPKTSRVVRCRYDADSFRRAIARGARKAGVKHWFPYQLRHSRGTATRKAYQLEGAQSVLRQRNAKTAGIYAERNLDLARKIARETG